MTQATDDKPEKRYYRIGEVARITGVKPYVLRYWESEFRWMSPAKSRSKQRLYRRLRELGVDGARETGQERAALSTPDDTQLELRVDMDTRTEFRRIREELQTIRALL
jgi:DNA-binding transcriptional MerR regulator